MGRRGLDTGSEVEDVVASSMSGGVFSTFTRGMTSPVDDGVGIIGGFVGVPWTGAKVS